MIRWTDIHSPISRDSRIGRSTFAAFSPRPVDKGVYGRMPLNHTPLLHEAIPCPELLSNGIGRVARRQLNNKGILDSQRRWRHHDVRSRLPRSFPEDAAVRCAIASFLLAFLVPTSARAADDKADLARPDSGDSQSLLLPLPRAGGRGRGRLQLCARSPRLVASRKIVPGNAARRISTSE